MKVIIIEPVTIEPVTLAEAKSHLRLDSATLEGGVATYQSIAPGNHAISEALEGNTVDILGKRAIVNLAAGQAGAGGTVNVKIQESDDGENWDDWYSFTQITQENDNATYEKEYTGNKRYLRALAAIAGAASDFGVDVAVYSGESAEDEQLSAWITAVREWGEMYTGRAFATQTLELVMDKFPATDYFDLKRPPVQSVTSVKYKDSTGTETTMTKDTDYLVDTENEPGRIVLPYGKTWPIFTSYPSNPIRTRYVAGYSPANPLPKVMKAAMLIHIALMYRYRDTEIPEPAMFAVKSLYAPYKVRWF